MINLNDWVKKQRVEKNQYFGVVVDRNDPLKDSRVRVRIDSLHKGVPDECLPFVRPSDVKNGIEDFSVQVPEIGTILEVSFKDDDFYNGVYDRKISEIKKEPESEEEQDFFAGYPNFRGFMTKSGNIVKLYDDGTIYFESCTGNKMNWDKEGTYHFESTSGNKLNWDKEGTLDFESTSGNKFHWEDDGDFSLTSKGGASLTLDDATKTFTMDSNLVVTQNITCTNMTASAETTTNGIRFTKHIHKYIKPTHPAGSDDTEKPQDGGN